MDCSYILVLDCHSPPPTYNSTGAKAMTVYYTTIPISYYVSLHWPPLWSSSQSSWLQIQRSGFDSRRYQIFWEVVSLERGPLSLVSITDKLLWRKSIVCGLESREYGRRDPSRWPRGNLYPRKLALTPLTSGGRSVSIVRSRTQATEQNIPRPKDSDLLDLKEAHTHFMLRAN
jgi:hypothetical protein